MVLTVRFNDKNKWHEEGNEGEQETDERRFKEEARLVGLAKGVSEQHRHLKIQITLTQNTFGVFGV